MSQLTRSLVSASVTKDRPGSAPPGWAVTVRLTACGPRKASLPLCWARLSRSPGFLLGRGVSTDVGLWLLAGVPRWGFTGGRFAAVHFERSPVGGPCTPETWAPPSLLRWGPPGDSHPHFASLKCRSRNAPLLRRFPALTLGGLRATLSPRDRWLSPWRPSGLLDHRSHLSRSEPCTSGGSLRPAEPPSWAAVGS